MTLPENLVVDYCQMLGPDNGRDMQVFAIQQLDQMLDEGIRKVLASGDLTVKVFGLVDYPNLPVEVQPS